MSKSLDVRQALTDLRTALVEEDRQLERDAWTARQRHLSVLAADLSSIRTRVGRLLRAIDKAADVLLRRDDYAPKET